MAATSRVRQAVGWIREYSEAMGMSELVLEHLRALRAVIDSINGKVDQLTVRVGGIEQGIVVLHQDVSNLGSIVAEQGTRLDRLTDCVGRIEQRLELTG
jgi:hypothetical protein